MEEGVEYKYLLPVKFRQIAFSHCEEVKIIK